MIDTKFNFCVNTGVSSLGSTIV